MSEIRQKCKIVSLDYINELEYLIMLMYNPNIKAIIDERDINMIERLEKLCMKIRTDEIKIIEVK